MFDHVNKYRADVTVRDVYEILCSLNMLHVTKLFDEYGKQLLFDQLRIICKTLARRQFLAFKTTGTFMISQEK